MNNILQALISFLPRNSEEQSIASRISRQELSTKLKEQFGIELEQSLQTIIQLVENLLTSHCLLDPEELDEGRWKFVSHPAQLCALSLLNTLVDPKQKLFSSDFWHSNVGDDEKQQQKKVLENLEDQRYEHNQNGSNVAVPIRFVYVAWGIIKLEDKILFHQREASEHASEYGLVGGRANVSDLKKLMGESVSNQDLLKTLQSPDSKEMFQSLEYTLRRECREEVKLLYDDSHFEIEPWHDLKPYTKCMGGAPNYALTQYFIRLYEIKLSTPGYFALRKQIKTDSRLIECSLDEVACGVTTDNAKSLRIEAIYNDFGNDRNALRQALKAMEPSYKTHYAFTDIKDGLIFTLENNILKGGPGKERSILHDLTTEQKSLLFALAAYGKGYPIKLKDSKAVTLHAFGWIEMHDEILQTELQQLSEFLRIENSSIIEVTAGNYFRLSVAPELIYFDSRYFECCLKQDSKNKYSLILKRVPLSILIGDIEPDIRKLPLEGTLGPQFKKVFESSDFSSIEDDAFPKKVRSALQYVYQSLGLRQLVARKGGCYTLTCRDYE